MRYQQLCKALLTVVGVFICSTLFAQQDSLQIISDTSFNKSDIPAEGPYYTLALGTLLIIFSIVMFATVLFLFALILLITAIFAACIVSGIISISVINGIRARSVFAGIKTFFWLLVPALTVLPSIAITWLIADFFRLHLAPANIWLVGITAGFFAGSLICFLLIKAGSKLYHFIVEKIRIK